MLLMQKLREWFSHYVLVDAIVMVMMVPVGLMVTPTHGFRDEV